MKLWLKQFKAITGNAFKVLISDALFFIMHISLLGGILLIASLPGFTLGGQLHLVNEQILALTFILGTFLTVISSARVISEDLTGMMSTIMSRPVSVSALMSGKWAGIVCSNALFFISSSIAALWATRLVKTEHMVETLGLSVYLGVILITLLTGVIRHYIRGGDFFKPVNIMLVILLPTAFFILNFWGYNGESASYGTIVDWQAAIPYIYVFMALSVFTSILVLCSIIMNVTTILVTGGIVFFFGMFSDFFLNLIFKPDSLFRGLASVIIPDWQMFSTTGTFNTGVDSLQASFFFPHLLQALFQILFFLTAAIIIFERNEVKDY
jgi:hypothetical protein